MVDADSSHLLPLVISPPPHIPHHPISHLAHTHTHTHTYSSSSPVRLPALLGQPITRIVHDICIYNIIFTYVCADVSFSAGGYTGVFVVIVLPCSFSLYEALSPCASDSSPHHSHTRPPPIIAGTHNILIRCVGFGAKHSIWGVKAVTRYHTTHYRTYSAAVVLGVLSRQTPLKSAPCGTSPSPECSRRTAQELFSSRFP